MRNLSKTLSSPQTTNIFHIFTFHSSYHLWTNNYCYKKKCKRPEQQKTRQ